MDTNFLTGCTVLPDPTKKKEFCLKIEHPERRTYWIASKDGPVGQQLHVIQLTLLLGDSGMVRAVRICITSIQ
jgi:uncharacterized protein (DUF3820 family)